jgi:hypothetical protein
MGQRIVYIETADKNYCVKAKIYELKIFIRFCLERSSLLALLFKSPQKDDLLFRVLPWSANGIHRST